MQPVEPAARAGRPSDLVCSPVCPLAGPRVAATLPRMNGTATAAGPAQGRTTTVDGAGRASGVATPAAGRSRAIVENVTPVVDGGRFPGKSVGGGNGARRGGCVHRRARQDQRLPAAPGRHVRHLARGRHGAPRSTTGGRGEFEVHAVGAAPVHGRRRGSTRSPRGSTTCASASAAGQDVGVDLQHRCGTGRGRGRPADERRREQDPSPTWRGRCAVGEPGRGDGGGAGVVAGGADAAARAAAARDRVAHAAGRCGSIGPGRGSAAGTSSSRAARRPTPGKHGHAAGRDRPAGRRAADGVRRALPAADPPDRSGVPQGEEQQHVSAEPGDVGSPWAIGAAEGGHDAIHPDLGTLGDFDAVVKAAGERGIETRAGHGVPVLAGSSRT